MTTGQKMQDLTGKRFGKLYVQSYSHKQNGSRKSSPRHYWRCICDCGNKTTVRSDHLKSEETKSCGCSTGNGRNDAFAEHKASNNLEYINNLKTRINELEHELEEEKQAKLKFREDNMRLRVSLKNMEESNESLFELGH